MERMFFSRGDYPNLFWTPYKWHLLGTTKLVASDNSLPVWHNIAACKRYEVPDGTVEMTFIDLDVPGEEQPDDVCRWCLSMVRTLDSEGTPDQRV